MTIPVHSAPGAVRLQNMELDSFPSWELGPATRCPHAALAAVVIIVSAVSRASYSISSHVCNVCSTKPRRGNHSSRRFILPKLFWLPFLETATSYFAGIIFTTIGPACIISISSERVFLTKKSHKQSTYLCSQNVFPPFAELHGTPLRMVLCCCEGGCLLCGHTWPVDNITWRMHQIFYDNLRGYKIPPTQDSIIPTDCTSILCPVLTLISRMLSRTNQC